MIDTILSVEGDQELLVCRWCEDGAHAGCPECGGEGSFWRERAAAEATNPGDRA